MTLFKEGLIPSNVLDYAVLAQGQSVSLVSSRSRVQIPKMATHLAQR